MRIMHVVCGPGAGGAEVFVKDMARSLVKEGHHVHLVFLQTAIESGRSESFSRSFLSDLEAYGIFYSFIGIRARRNLLFGILRLRKIIREVSPDIVHAHLYHALFFMHFVPAIPVVFTKHSIKLGAPRFILRLLLMRASAFVAICGACKNKFKNIMHTRLVQIDNGTSFKGRASRNFPDSPTVKLLYVGRLYSVKNIGMLLTACSKIRDLDFILSIAGEGPELGYLRELTESLGIGHKVSFLGNIEDVATQMSRSDVFLLSSLSEGLPISLIEASLSGLPCLVTDVGGCKEVIERCQNGFAVPVDDLHAYSQKLRALIEDVGLRDRLSLNASKYSGYYSIDRVVKEHQDLYQAIL